MDYNQLLLVFKNYYQFSQEIKSLLDNNDYDGIQMAISRREKLSKQLVLIIKQFPDKNEYPKEILNLIDDIDKLEKENLERMTKIRSELKVALDKINAEDKILSAYEPKEIKSRMIDISE